MFETSQHQQTGAESAGQVGGWVGAAQCGGGCPKQHSSTGARRIRHRGPRGRVGTGRTACQRSGVGRLMKEQQSRRRREGRAERLWAQPGNGESDIGKPGSKGRYALGRLGRVILSLQRNKLSRRSSQWAEWTIPEMRACTCRRRCQLTGCTGWPRSSRSSADGRSG